MNEYLDTTGGISGANETVGHADSSSYTSPSDMFDRYFSDVMARLDRQQRSPDNLDHYAQVGQAVQRLQQPIQMQQPMADSGGPSQQGGGDLTSGYDPNWLATALAAGSANGAKIGGAGGGMGGGGKGNKKDAYSANEFADYGGGESAGWAGGGAM